MELFQAHLDTKERWDSQDPKVRIWLSCLPRLENLRPRDICLAALPSLVQTIFTIMHLKAECVEWSSVRAHIWDCSETMKMNMVPDRAVPWKVGGSPLEVFK